MLPPDTNQSSDLSAELNEINNGEPDHITYNEISKPPEKVLEFDVQVRPAEPNRLLALYETESGHEDEINEAINGRQGYLEKHLSDFFDIQIFSTVYFGSRHEPHQLIFDTGSSWLWVQTPQCSTCATKNAFNYIQSKTFK